MSLHCRVIIAGANPGTPYSRCHRKVRGGREASQLLCAEHRKTYAIRWVPCSGEAHGNPYVDHCGVCQPWWGEYPVAVKAPALLDAASAALRALQTELKLQREQHGTASSITESIALDLEEALSAAQLAAR